MLLRSLPRSEVGGNRPTCFKTQSVSQSIPECPGVTSASASTDAQHESELIPEPSLVSECALLNPAATVQNSGNPR